MFRTMVVLIGLSLAGCVSDVRDTMLSEVDLTNSRTLSQVAQELTPTERALLGTYVVRHLASSASFCGQPLTGADGKEPATIGQAIALTQARDAAEKKALAQLRAPRTGGSSAKERWAYLISDRDRIISRQSVLRLQFGASALQRADWKESEKEIAALDRELKALKSKGF